MVCHQESGQTMVLKNVDVARYMLYNRGTGRSSIITGSSIHNQRIERLWRDVLRVVVTTYRNIILLPRVR